jgi:hypothetical protein
MTDVPVGNAVSASHRRAMLSDSMLIASGRRLAVVVRSRRRANSGPPSPALRSRASVGEAGRGGESAQSSGSDDEKLIRIADASLPMRWLTAAGQRVLVAWRESIAAAGYGRWRAVPLDRRIQATALVVIAAIVTHVAVTGFRAPEPTTPARIAWIGILVVLIAIATHAHGVEAAWRTWRSRAGGRETL